jgi:hypothetical protein
MFKKASNLAPVIFQKGRELTSNFSNVAKQAADGLAVASRVGKQILDNEGVKDYVAKHQKLQGLYDVGGEAVNHLQTGASLAKQVSHLSNEKSYNSGNHVDNIKDALQRAKSIKNDAQPLFV